MSFNYLRPLNNNLLIPISACLRRPDAVRVLDYFCGTLRKGNSSLVARYSYFEEEQTEEMQDDQEQEKTENLPKLKCKVVLPASIDSQFRVHISQSAWTSQGKAKADAAFVACKKLYEMKFLNDNLSPLHAFTLGPQIKHQVVEAEVVQVSAWSLERKTSKIQTEDTPPKDTFICRAAQIQACSLDGDLEPMVMGTDEVLPPIPPFTIRWENGQSWTINIVNLSDTIPDAHMRVMTQITKQHLRVAWPKRAVLKDEKYAYVFFPQIELEELPKWYASHQDISAEKFLASEIPLPDSVVIKEINSFPFFGLFKGLNVNNSIDDSIDTPDKPSIRVERFTRRRHFPLDVGLRPRQSAQINLRLGHFAVEGLPVSSVKWGILLPTIQIQIEMRLVAQHLSQTILAKCQFQDLELVLTAITSPSVGHVSDYQRLEYIGDKVLKFNVILRYMAKHLYWHEGLLTRKAEPLSSNLELYRAALLLGLEKYIITRRASELVTGPPVMEQDLSNTEPSTKISSNVIADVVEALLGAAYAEGSWDKATKFLQILHPNLAWESPGYYTQALREDAEKRAKDVKFNIDADALKLIERMIGYSFNNKLLLREAFTHPSSDSENEAGNGRLELLGDAVLDMAIAPKLYNHERQLSPGDMTLMNTTLVNRDLLGFLCFDRRIERVFKDVSPSTARAGPTITTRTEYVSLAEFLRHNSEEIAIKRLRVMERYGKLQERIHTALNHDEMYPWQELTLLDVPKTYCDLFESLLGAIFVDSNGSWEACSHYLDNMGLSRYLDRLLGEEGVDLGHPKSILQEMVVRKDGTEPRYETAETDKQFTCRVRIGDELFDPVTATKRHHAENGAAQTVLKILRARTAAVEVNPAVSPDLESASLGGKAGLDEGAYSE